jgi:phosphoribosylamine---glycine ligase
VKVMVLGSGAREHALIVALATDGDVTEVVGAPGNPGISDIARCLPVDMMDGPAVAAVAAGWGADLVVIGPEAPLVAGVADAVRAAGIACFGPSAEAARLEGSKAFAKQVMAEAAVPTALAHVCTDLAEVSAALSALGPPHVVKDDGLAAGKGVLVTDDLDQAMAHAATCLAGSGDARVVVEEFLDGPEVSLFCVTDGITVVPLTPAQDFKRLREGDRGPNTGGMGAYSPLPWASPTLAQDVADRIAEPTVAVMRRRGTPFVGLLYVGLAMTERGPKVVEFNARFGDPETQVVLARLLTPLGGLLHAAATGMLADEPALRWRADAAVSVVLASPGYPEAAITGGSVTGLAEAAAVPGATVLHAGTARGASPSGGAAATGLAGDVVAAGGRVISVVGTGPDLAAARDTAYAALALIRLDGAQYRADIGTF